MLSLSSRLVRDIMSTDVATVNEKTSLQEAAQLMSKGKTGSLVVMAGKKPKGILTERDFVKLIEQGLTINPKAVVKDIYVSKLVTITPSTRFSKAFSILNTYGYRQLPVVQNGSLKGMLTMQNMMTYSRNNLIGAIEENRNLERKVNVDHLTKLFNRRYLNTRAEAEFDRCKRYGIRTSVIFFDIDHFKSINDTYSHDAGDYVLMTLGKLLKKSARHLDVIARYGGEEFVMITPSTNSPQATLLGQKIKEIVENYTFSYRGKRLKITVSGGVASFSSATSAKQALGRADKALYYAKEHGRNMICRWKDSTNTIEEFTGTD